MTITFCFTPSFFMLGLIWNPKEIFVIQVPLFAVVFRPEQPQETK